MDKIPMQMNLGGPPNWENCIGWASWELQEGGIMRITIDLFPEDSEKLQDLEKIFDIEAIGFAGVRRESIIEIGREVIVEGMRARVTSLPYFLKGYGTVYSIQLQPPVRFAFGTSISTVSAVIREPDLIAVIQEADRLIEAAKKITEEGT